MSNQDSTRSGIEDTSRRDPMLHMLGALGGSDRYIEEQEAAGQRQLVNSTMLPTKMNSGTDDDLIALGFELGDPDPSDPMFRPVTLPKGWSKTGTDHSMWSKVVDELGRARLMVFYKAAFYDRDAFVNVQSPDAYAWDVINGSPLILDDEWATEAAIREALLKKRAYEEEGEKVLGDEDGYYAKQYALIDAALAQLPGGES